MADNKQFWRGVQAEAGMVPYEEKPVPERAPAVSSPSETVVFSAPNPLGPEIRVPDQIPSGVPPSRTQPKRNYFQNPSDNPAVVATGIFLSFGVLLALYCYALETKDKRLCSRILTSSSRYDQPTVDSFCEDPCNSERFSKEYYALGKDNLGREALERAAIHQAGTLVEKVREVCYLPEKGK